MPTHDYQCDACYYAFEEIGTIAEHEEVLKGPCPKCGAKKIRKLFRCAPAVKTATTWLRGQGTLLDHFGDHPEGRQQLKERIAIARSQGFNPNRHHVYDETIARYPGDPEAFIPHDDPAGHVKRVVERRGLPCDGPLIKSKGAEPQPIAPAPLADDLVQDLAAEKIRKNPDLGQKTKAEVTEMVRDQHDYK